MAKHGWQVGVLQSNGLIAVISGSQVFGTYDEAAREAARRHAQRRFMKYEPVPTAFSVEAA